MSKDPLPQFKPAPGYLVVEIIEEDSTFRPKVKPDDTQARRGEVLAVGNETINEFGTKQIAPCAVGDKILFTWQYNQAELEIDYKKYPVIRFNQFLGIFQ